MPTVKSRNVYSDTSLYLISVKDGKLGVKHFPDVGKKGCGTDFLNATSGIETENAILVGPHMDNTYDIEPTIITDIQEQRTKVFRHLCEHYTTFKPEDVCM